MSRQRPQYPCASCGKACNKDAIECSACQLWVHRECVPMDKNMMREWDAPGLDFLCRACSFTSDPDPVTYDFAAACKRLQDAANSPSLQYVLSAEHLLLRTYEVKLPPIVASSYPGSTDPQAREILQKFQPVILNPSLCPRRWKLLISSFVKRLLRN
ncbi:hypothetical protein ElyMa_005897400 [Elysia marginata]|uniref:Zinc finger PHD-type domain-containing protein n=1 Tax=Elysia marginata TaxID=1093978 RepID=A0AAV4G5D4_9GAST|nr:hypothetical protein ElyMa_005897400 [Elysia marginata]